MKTNEFTIMYVLIAMVLNSCNAQTSKNTTLLTGGPCEGCEALYEYGDKMLTSIDTLPRFGEYKPSIKITGTVYQKDGKTPAEDVILYIYHTNRDGVYEKKGDEQGWARRHGFIRGWIKTGADGKYTFYTFRPASYPDGSEPEHIHLTVKEPGKNEYYMDDYLFNDDPLFTEKIRRERKNRGGSGIVAPTVKDGMLTIKRDIVLGRNIPDYN